MDELIKAINALLIKANNTFIYEPVIKKDANGEDIISELKIKSLKNDGVEFTSELFNFFSPIIEKDNNYELAFDKDKGFVIVKNVVTNVIKKENVF